MGNVKSTMSNDQILALYACYVTLIDHTQSMNDKDRNRFLFSFSLLFYSFIYFVIWTFYRVQAVKMNLYLSIFQPFLWLMIDINDLYCSMYQFYFRFSLYHLCSRKNKQFLCFFLFFETFIECAIR